MNVSGLGTEVPSPLHQVLICGTVVLPQLRQRAELISRHHDDPLAGHFGIEKIRELIAPVGGRTYPWIL